MNLNKEQIKTYLIDCIGYSNDDLQLSKDQLLDLVDNEQEMVMYSN